MAVAAGPLLAMTAAKGGHAADPSPGRSVLRAATDEIADAVLRARIAPGAGGNLCFSPHGLASALALLALGASGTTQKWLEAEFGIASSDLADAQAALRQDLATAGADFEMLSAVWLRDGTGPTGAFASAARRGFDATVERVDFTDDGTVDRINAWVNARTDGRIPDLVDALPANTDLVVTNALRFAGLWTERFDEAASTEAPFRLANGERRPVRMMISERTVDYGETDTLQVARLDYGDGGFRAVIAVPKDGDGAPAMSALLATDGLSTLRGIALERREAVRFDLPVFAARSSTDLTRALGDTKFQPLLEPDADLSGITGRALRVPSVAQTTLLTVDESGTESASGTAAVAVPTSATHGGTRMTVDRPFVFVVEEAATGLPLVAAYVANPTPV